MTFSKEWRWVNALDKRLSERADDNDRPTIATNNDGEPFIIWDSWDQLKRVHKIAGLMGTDHNGDPFNRNDEYPEAIDKRMNYETGFNDEWAVCNDCYTTLIRTSPDSYSWTPDFYVDENGYMCSECMAKDPESVIEGCMNEGKAIPDQIDPTDHGWVQVNLDSYESGFHPGQNDSPAKVMEVLKKGYLDCLFTIDEASQFYTTWSVYVRDEDLTAARKALGIVDKEIK